MKKSVSLLLCLMLAFSSLFVSCDENEASSGICKVTVKSDGGGNVAITNFIGTSANVLLGNMIEVVATPNDGYAFTGWYIDGIDTPVSSDAKFAFTVSESIALTAKFENEGINGHEYVDLGLSVKWATCNVGASTPGDYGDYYAWGETTTKSDYSSSTSTTYGKQMSNIAGNPTYDVARKKWGSPWRLPTEAEFQELIDNCTWEWTTQNGHNGYKVTSKKNGNSIFLPAAGWCSGTWSSVLGADGGYWSATPNEGSTVDAYGLGFYEGDRSTNWGRRYHGHSVRPVSQN